MEDAQKVKTDFPLVKTISRDKLIEWFRETLSPKLHTIKELGTGADFCLGVELLFPGCIGKYRIKFDNPSVYEKRQNFKLLQRAFNSLKLNKDVPIEKLEEGNYRETYYFALWFKAFFESNYKNTSNSLKPFQSSTCPVELNMRKSAAGGFRQSTGSSPPKEAEAEIAPELRKSINSGKDTREINSPPQRKRKPFVFAQKIINPRMPTFSRMEQETRKVNKSNKTSEQQKMKALVQQTEELEKAVKDLTERKKVFEKSQADFEKQIESVEETKTKMNAEPDEMNETLIQPDTVKIFDCLEDIKEEDEDETNSIVDVEGKQVNLEIELEQINQVVREQRRIIDALEQQKESKGEQIVTLERIVCELTQAIKELENAKQNQARKIKELEESINVREKPVEGLEQIMNEQLKSLEELTQTKEEQSKKIEDLEQTNNDLSLSNTMLTKSNKAMAVHIEDLEQNYRDITKQNDNLTKCNKELACHYNDLSNENRELNQRNKRLAKNYETILCYSCLDANLYFKQLVKIEKACKRESNNCLRKCINAILNQTKYHPPLAPGSCHRKEHKWLRKSVEPDQTNNNERYHSLTLFENKKSK